MAQKVVLIDDLDGSEATRTVRFSYEGTEYEIDLSEANDADTAEPRRRGSVAAATAEEAERWRADRQHIE